MLNTIKTALEIAHDEMGNRSAISVKNMSERGITITDQTFKQWETYVEELRQAAIAYNKASHDPNSSDNSLSRLQGKVWAAWREVLKEGTEEEFNKNFFVRKGDVVHICGLCGEYFQNSVKGKCIASHTKTDFRKNIETLIGVRMAGNGLLSDEDRDTIKAYEGAVNNIANKTALLETGTKRNGEDVPSLKAQLKGAKSKLSKFSEKIKDFKMSDEEKTEFLKEFKVRVDEINKAIKAAEDSIAESQKVKDENETKYNALLDRLNIAGLNA